MFKWVSIDYVLHKKFQATSNSLFIYLIYLLCGLLLYIFGLFNRVDWLWFTQKDSSKQSKIHHLFTVWFILSNLKFAIFSV